MKYQKINTLSLISYFYNSPLIIKLQRKIKLEFVILDFGI